MLPALSLGLWHSFGEDRPAATARAICRQAFDLGITHFDLANNYGPPPGSAETLFGDILRTDFRGYRDELIISTKAGYRMWPGPYGEWGSRKYLIASLDQSLKRMGLDYVDIFYSHRFDPNTPLEETMGALDQVVRQGKALYVGISSYNSRRSREAVAILKRLGTPVIIHQPSYSMLNRWIEEDGLLDTLDDLGMGSIVFSPLAQGLLTDKYLGGHPGRQPRRRRQVAAEGLRLRRGGRAHPRAGRHRGAARPVAGADGHRLGAARRPRHHGADRRQPARAGRRQRRRAEESRLLGRGTGRDRRPRHRQQHQPVGRLGRAPRPRALSLAPSHVGRAVDSAARPAKIAATGVAAMSGLPTIDSLSTASLPRRMLECGRCGAPFECGAGTGADGQCWCAAPAYPPAARFRSRRRRLPVPGLPRRGRRAMLGGAATPVTAEGGSHGGV